MTIADPAKPLAELDPEPGEPSVDHDATGPVSRHLTLVASDGGTVIAASRRASMARHPSAAPRP